MVVMVLHAEPVPKVPTISECSSGRLPTGRKLYSKDDPGSLTKLVWRLDWPLGTSDTGFRFQSLGIKPNPTRSGQRVGHSGPINETDWVPNLKLQPGVH